MKVVDLFEMVGDGHRLYVVHNLKDFAGYVSLTPRRFKAIRDCEVRFICGDEYDVVCEISREDYDKILEVG